VYGTVTVDLEWYWKSMVFRNIAGRKIRRKELGSGADRADGKREC
jgi:hypothetical protein